MKILIVIIAILGVELNILLDSEEKKVKRVIETFFNAYVETLTISSFV